MLPIGGSSALTAIDMNDALRRALHAGATVLALLRQRILRLPRPVVVITTTVPSAIMAGRTASLMFLATCDHEDMAAGPLPIMNTFGTLAGAAFVTTRLAMKTAYNA